MSSSLFQDCSLFTGRMKEKGKKFSGVIESSHITKMINDELKELSVAKDDAEFVDALLDISYYILQHLGTTSIDFVTEWENKYHFPLEFDVLKEKFFHACISDTFFNDKDKEVFSFLINLHLPILNDSNTNSGLNKLLPILNLCLTYPYTKGLDIKPIWKLIHTANMTKFGDGGYYEGEKWMKPKNFVSPDDDIRKEVLLQKPRTL